jgi:hypothetical protein
LTGPFTTTKDLNKYILVFKCALTGWVEVFAIPDKSAITVAKCLWDEVYMRHGAPREIISDRGTEFTNQYFAEIHKLLDVRHIKITPANPQANGVAENFMRTLKDMLVSVINRHGTDWDEYVATVAHWYRTAINPETGYSPFFLVMGREASIPAADYLPAITMELSEFAENRREVMEQLWEEQGWRTTKHTELFNRSPLKHQKFEPYAVGEYFFHKQVPRRYYRDNKQEGFIRIGTKLQFRYSGPYKIVKRVEGSEVVYDALIHNVIRRVHVINMKRM